MDKFSLLQAVAGPVEPIQIVVVVGVGVAVVVVVVVVVMNSLAMDRS